MSSECGVWGGVGTKQLIDTSPTAPRTCCVCNQVKGGDQFPLRAYQSLTNVSKPFACIVCHEAQLKEEEDLAHDEGTEDEQNLEMETTNDCSFCYEYFNGPTQEFMLIVS